MASYSRPDDGHGRPHERSRGSIVVPVVLISLGVLFLLQNFGWVGWDVWGSLWRLWPLLLILIGAEILVGGRGHVGLIAALVGLLAIVGIGAVLAVAWFTPVSSRITISGGASEEVQPLDGATRANVEVRFGAGRLTLGAQEGGEAGTLARMTFNGPEELRPRSTYEVQGGVGQLEYTLRGESHRHFSFVKGPQSAADMELRLNPSIPYSLNLQTGASESNFDLGPLRVSDLQLQVGASNTRLGLPEQGQTSARVQGGAASMEIIIPPNVAAQIRYQGGLSTLDVDQTRFPSVGDNLYRSPNYETATDRVDLHIEAGVASVTVR